MNKKIKTVEESVAAVVAGPVTKQNIELVFYSYDAFGMEESKFYEDIMGYQMNGDWVAISLKDGTTWVHPKEEIKLLKHYNVTE